MRRGRKKVVVAFKKGDAVKLGAALLEMQKFTGRDMRSVTMQAAVWFCQSARKATPLSVKKREVEKVKVKGGLPTYNIIKYSRNGEITRIPTDDINDNRRLVENRGLAKNTWSGCIKKLFKNSPMIGSSGNLGYERSEAVANFGQGKSSVTVANKLDYIEKLDRGSPTNPPYHIMAIAYGNTTRRINGLLWKSWKKQARKFKI